MDAAPRARPHPISVALIDSITEWGGGEKWCLEAALALRARGHRAAIACRRASAIEARARAAGVDTWSGIRSGPGALAAALALGRWARRNAVEVAVATTGGDVRAAAVASLVHPLCVVQRRGIARPLRRDWVSRWLYRRVVRLVIANSDAIRDALLSSAPWAARERFVVLPNGVEVVPPGAPDREDARSRLGIGAGALAVGAVGRLAPMKGHDHLLAAWSEVRVRHPSAVLLVAGDGVERERLEARARELGLGDSVRWLGFRRDLEDVWRALDLFVQASVRDEGASHALLEAMAHGLCAVVTRCGGLTEVVAERETALVVPPADPAALAAALGELGSDPGLRRRMGAAARERARARFSTEVAADQLEALLLRVRDGA